MAEAGVLRPDARVELLDGEIIDMSPIGSFHGGVTNYLNEIFTTASKRRWVTAVQNPVRLDDHSEPQPDLVLLKPSPDFYRRQHPQPADVHLLIEVSDSSLTTEREASDLAPVVYPSLTRCSTAVSFIVLTIAFLLWQGL